MNRTPFHPVAGVVVLACTLTITAACGDTGEQNETYRPPGERGPFAVGCLSEVITLSSGDPTLVEVWFPSSGQSTSIYFYDALAEGTALDGLEPDCTAPRPVFMFSHGSGGIRWQSPFLMEHLASRGTIIAAPDHVYNTVSDSDQVQSEHAAEVVLRRPQDIIDAYEWLLSQSNDPQSPLFGCVDPAAGYTVGGHSFGGYTSLALSGATIDISDLDGTCQGGDPLACEVADLWIVNHPGEDTANLSDPRVRGLVALAPWDGRYLAEGIGNVFVPALFLTGDLDDRTPLQTMVRPMFETLTATPRYFGIIADGGHLSFMGLCNYLPNYPGCTNEYRDPDQVYPLTNELVAAFLDSTRGQAEALPYLAPNVEWLTWESVD